MATEQSNHQVVAALITHKGRVALFQRSSLVTGGNGLWHCVTGFLPAGCHPARQALDEISEEAGISARLLKLRAYEVFDKAGRDCNVWKVHAFHYECLTEEISLNWENDASDWVSTQTIQNYPTVDWLEDILIKFGMFYQNEPKDCGDHVDPWRFTADLRCAAIL